MVEQDDQLFSNIRIKLEKWIKDYEAWQKTTR